MLDKGNPSEEEEEKREEEMRKELLGISPGVSECHHTSFNEINEKREEDLCRKVKVLMSV